MDFSTYSNDIQTIISNIEFYRRNDSKLVLTYCDQLIQHAKKHDDPVLYGYGYYYMCEAYFSFHDYPIFLHYLVKGITYQQKTNDEFLLARSYNLLAISADSQGNLVSALDYYLTALKYCENTNLKYESGLVYTNIGHLYVTLKEYNTAIRYFELGLDYMAYEKQNSFYFTNLALSFVAIGNCYYNLGYMDQAMDYANQYNHECPKTCLKDYSQVAYQCFYIKLLTALEQFKERDILITQCIPNITSITSLLDIYYEIFDFCEHLFQIKKYDELWQVLNYLELLTNSADIAHLQLKVLNLKIQYFKLFSDEPNYLQATSRFFTISEKMHEVATSTTLSTINLRFSLEEIRSLNDLMEEENRMLQERSERDSLTGLPNRYRLNDYSEEAFERAFNNQTSLAVEIFDVDCFKQFNDTYGHQAGDDCLCLIANFLKEIMREDIFCARYGGDEFIIIYENKSDEEIMQIATKLKQSVEELKIKHANSIVAPYLTISQGVRNSIPSIGNKMWDFLFAADAALYQVKQSQKNDILLVHKTTSKKADTNMIQYINN
ncbi:MAG: diguanylate cyclase domain-containing protein [Velocimicrobium sp.]